MNKTNKTSKWWPSMIDEPPLIEVPTTYSDPPLYRIQPYHANKPYYFWHKNENRFSLEHAPCCYLSDDYETAFKEAIHYLINMAIKAKEKKQGRPVISQKILMNKGVWTLALKEKVTLIDLTAENIRNRFGIPYHPGYDQNYAKVHVFAEAALEYRDANPSLNIQGFYYPTQNSGHKAIAI